MDGLESIRLVESAPQPNHEVVGPGAKGLTNLEAMRRELGVQSRQGLAVEFHGSGGVDGIEAELQAFTLQELCIDLELGPPHPVGVTHEGLSGFATDRIGIGNQSRVEQGIVYTAGNLCRNRRMLEGFDRPA